MPAAAIEIHASGCYFPALVLGGLGQDHVVKNPWMSAWLSAANKSAGTARGYWMNEGRRQQQVMAREVARAWGLEPSRRETPSRRKPKR